MKSVLKLIVLTSALLISSCGNPEFVLYEGSEPIVDGDVTIKLDKLYEYSLIDTYHQDIYVSFVNSNPKPATLKFNDYKIYRERDNAEYTTGCLSVAFARTIDLECDVEKTLIFTTNLPTSLNEDNYKLVIHYDSKALICHLYSAEKQQKNA